MKRTALLSAIFVAALSVGAWSSPAAAIAANPTLVMDSNTNATQQAIRAVIQKGNDEQQQAIAQNNPSLMQNTATSDYYNQLVQTNQDLQSSGVTSIKLLNLRWGRISQTADGLWQAGTLETWQTTYADGSVDSSTDRNVYTLVQQNGAWKIQADNHPDSQVEIPVPVTQPSPGQPGPQGQSQSSNWSGYQASGGTFSGISGTWVVPHASGGGSFGADATWVGIGGVTSHDLIQAGTEATAAGPGQAQYGAWIETLPQASRPISLPVNAGDSVTVSINQQSSGQWLVSLKDNTSGQSYQRTIAYNSSESSAEWIEEAPSNGRGLLPLDNFGTIPFTAASTIKNGQTVNIAAAGGQPVTMINEAGQAVATTSALGSDGGSFTVTRTNAQTGGTGVPVITIPVGPGGFPTGRGLGAFPGGRGFGFGGSDD